MECREEVGYSVCVGELLESQPARCCGCGDTPGGAALIEDDRRILRETLTTVCVCVWQSGGVNGRRGNAFWGHGHSRVRGESTMDVRWKTPRFLARVWRLGALVTAALALVSVLPAMPAESTSRLDPKRPTLHSFWSLGTGYAVAKGHTGRNDDCVGAQLCKDYVQLERKCLWRWCAARQTTRWYSTTSKYGARKGTYTYSTRHVAMFWTTVADVTVGIERGDITVAVRLPIEKWKSVADSSHRYGETLRFTAPYSYRM